MKAIAKVDVVRPVRLVISFSIKKLNHLYVQTEVGLHEMREYPELSELDAVTLTKRFTS